MLAVRGSHRHDGDVSTTGVSVAIATLDRPDGLAKCLAAVLAGDVPPDEVLVVDQGDPGPTSEVLAAVATGVPLRHAPSSERGLSRSRNLALALAAAPVLAMTDDDCVPDPGWVAAIASRLTADPALGGVTGPIIPGRPIGVATMAVSSRTGTREAVFTEPRAPWLVGSGGNFAARASALRAAGGFDVRLGAGAPGRAAEDLDVFLRILAAGWPIAYDPAARVRHARQPPGRRWSTRWTYGHGLGAAAGVRVRREPGVAARLLSDWTDLRAHRAAGALRARDVRRVAEEVVVLGGTLTGLARGFAGRLDP
jgi:glycosyltransferase involved in cell wall biosynthesis